MTDQPQAVAAPLWQRLLIATLSSPAVQRVTCVVGVLGAFCYGSAWVKADVAKHKRFQIPVNELKLGSPPAYLSKKTCQDIERLQLPKEYSNAFESRLIPSLAYTLEQMPWVDKVEELRLEYPNRIHFKLSLLDPSARVKVGPRSLAVASDGRRFPERYLAPKDSPGARLLPELRGWQWRFDGRPVLVQVLTLVDSLRSHGLLKRLGLVAIDIQNLKGRVDPRQSEVVLVTASGLRIDWGRLESSQGIHFSFPQKLARLKDFLDRGPDLKTVQSVSFRWDETIFVPRPVPTKPAETIARR